MRLMSLNLFMWALTWLLLPLVVLLMILVWDDLSDDDDGAVAPSPRLRS